MTSFPARIIPCLLLRDGGLVKTVGFSQPTYIGDPINAVRIFNDKEVDELVLLDIRATIEGRGPTFQLVAELAGECFMPLAYGGGICTLDHAHELFRLGVEKIVLNTAAVEDPALLRQLAERFGSQSVVASIDVRRQRFGRYSVYTRSGQKDTGLDPVTAARRAEENGAGEILLTAIDREGTMTGYDLELIRRVSQAIGIPVIAHGGAGKVADLTAAVTDGGASAAAAGSLFVFVGKHRAVLISYPSRGEMTGAAR